MKKKNVLLIAGISLCLCAACGTKTETAGTVDTSVEKEDTKEISTETAKTAEADETDTQEEEVYEYPSETAAMEVNQSPLGYSMEWDQTVFTLTQEDGMDSYQYNTQETLDAPVFISVLEYSDMDAKTLAEGLALQSGIDGVTAEDTYFADGIEAKSVYYETEENGVTNSFVFYAIPKEDGALLVEIDSYVGIPDEIGAKLEEMLGTFTLQE